MAYKFKNWATYQSFNHKRPVHSWKKVYTSTLHDYDFNQLEEFEQARFFKMILLADPATGTLPDRVEELEFQLGIRDGMPKLDLSRFSKFLELVGDLRDAGNVPVDYRHDTAQEKSKSRGEEIRYREEIAHAYSIPEPTRDADLEKLASLFGKQNWFEYAAVCRWYYDNHTGEFLGALKQLQDSIDPKIRAAKGLSNPGQPHIWFLCHMKAHMKSLGRKLPSSKQLESPPAS